MPVATFALAGSADDAWASRNDTVYPPATATSYSDVDTVAYTERWQSAGTYEVTNSLFRFLPPGGFPATAIVPAATFRGTLSGGALSADSRSFVMDWGPLAMSAADYSETALSNAHAGTPLTSLVAGVANDFSLVNAPGNVSTASLTYLRGHISGGVPTGDNHCNFVTYDGTPASAAQLLVYYYLAGSTNTNSNEYASAQDGTTPTGYAGQLTNPANAVGSGETSQATSTGATQSSNYGSFYSFAGEFADIPANATITGVTLEARQWIGTTTRGTIGMSLHSAANTLIGTELAGALSITAAPTAGTAGTGNSYTAWTTLPTVAQLLDPGFRVRVRFTRTAAQAVTYTLDWLRLTVTYTAPAVAQQVLTQTLQPISFY